jgi:hypothetical protein
VRGLSCELIQMSSSLPHLQQRDDRRIDEIVSSLREGRETEECYLAVSHGFWEVDEDAFEETFAAYEQYYTDLIAQISQLLGPPDFQGRWDTEEFPGWAHGEQVAVWSNGMWLRIEHEDRECPIIIALTLVPA